MDTVVEVAEVARRDAENARIREASDQREAELAKADAEKRRKYEADLAAADEARRTGRRSGTGA